MCELDNLDNCTYKKAEIEFTGVGMSSLSSKVLDY